MRYNQHLYVEKYSDLFYRWETSTDLQFTDEQGALT